MLIICIATHYTSIAINIDNVYMTAKHIHNYNYYHKVPHAMSIQSEIVKL